MALSIEASLQQRIPLNDAVYFIMVFAATIAYYSNAYIKTETSLDAGNERSVWYAKNKLLAARSRLLFLLIALFSATGIVIQNFSKILAMEWQEFVLVLIFPLMSLFYYGLGKRYNRIISLRRIGWLKPFTIGFIWAGVANIYPLMYYNIVHGLHYHLSLVGTLLFVKNFMFVTVLCIMFDIKDYAMDYNQHLKTFVVKAGLRFTIFYIIIPLTMLGLASFILFAFLQHFLPGKIILNTLPFLLILLVAYSLQTRKSIFYYLVIIDGLMLVKALCGSLAMHYF